MTHAHQQGYYWHEVLSHVMGWLRVIDGICVLVCTLLVFSTFSKCVCVYVALGMQRRAARAGPNIWHIAIHVAEVGCMYVATGQRLA